MPGVGPTGQEAPARARGLDDDLRYDGSGTEEWNLDDRSENAPARRWDRLALAAACALVVTVAACSSRLYEPLDHEADLTGAYGLAFQAACDIDCGAGREVSVVISPTDPAVQAAIIDSTPATVTTAISPIAVRDGLAEGEVAIVYSVEAAALAGDVAIVRIGRSEVTTEISAYVGRDYLLSREADGRWVLRTSEDTGITTTTAIS